MRPWHIVRCSGPALNKVHVQMRRAVADTQHVHVLGADRLERSSQSGKRYTHGGCLVQSETSEPRDMPPRGDEQVADEYVIGRFDDRTEKYGHEFAALQVTTRDTNIAANLCADQARPDP